MSACLKNIFANQFPQIQKLKAFLGPTTPHPGFQSLFRHFKRSDTTIFKKPEIPEMQASSQSNSKNKSTCLKYICLGDFI